MVKTASIKLQPQYATMEIQIETCARHGVDLVFAALRSHIN